MPRTTVHEVTCCDCETTTTVAQTIWPATRVDPEDGEISPEECPKCGRPFDSDSKWEDSEPPEPDHHHYEEDWRE